MRMSRVLIEDSKKFELLMLNVTKHMTKKHKIFFRKPSKFVLSGRVERSIP